MAKKKTTQNSDKSFEESLWNSANRLRGSVESSEYKHVVLSLIFLKFVSDKFEERLSELIAEGKGKYADMVEFYTMKNVFYLPQTSRWNHIQQHAKQGDIAIKIDSALAEVEKSNSSLKGALPNNYFSRLGLDGSKLSALIDTINNIDTVADKEEDVVGRVYEYFLGKFAASEGKLGGEFYTPKCVVNLIAEMIEPYRGKIYDPCCGSGGMFVQSLKFVESHHGNTKDISVYGQEFTSTTYKLAKMNLAVRGLSANLGEVPADTFFKDQHPLLKADYIMANPPFNLKNWRAKDELTSDPSTPSALYRRVYGLSCSNRYLKQRSNHFTVISSSNSENQSFAIKSNSCKGIDLCLFFLYSKLWMSIVCRKEIIMGYPTKIQLISRKKGNQWYVNFPNALAEAMNFKKGETVEWEVESLTVLKMSRKVEKAVKE